MAYLIDSNCFIQPKNEYYGFDFCPGYWDWLDQQHQLGIVYSIDKIGLELRRGNDELATWAHKKDDSFFLPVDPLTLSQMQIISLWVSTAGFRLQAIPEFMSCADPFLIAFALAHGHTVVSHERLIDAQTNKIKIPRVCQQFNVPCINIFDLLRTTGAKLGLSP